MNRYIIIFSWVLVLLVLIFIGVLFFVRSNEPAPTNDEKTPSVIGQNDNGQSSNIPTKAISNSGSVQDVQAVKATYQTSLSKNNVDNIQIYDTVVQGGYALQSWGGDSMGGEALLKYESTQAKWVIVDPGGGAWSVDGLVQFGVPRDIAQILINGMGR